MSNEAMIRNPAVEELAVKLRLPPDVLPALRELTPEQAALLGELIDGTRARRRAALESAVDKLVRMRPVSRAALRVLRRGARS